MSTLEQMVHAFAKKYPTPHSHPLGGDYDWDQDCGRVMSRMCLEYGSEPTGNVYSARYVASRSRVDGTDPSAAPPGAFHFLDIGGPGNGHAMLDVFGGASSCFQGNSGVLDIEGAVNLGFNSVAGYMRYRPTARYLFWSRNYADGSLGSFEIPTTPPTVVLPGAATLGPIIRSGPDWAYRRPSGELAKRVSRALIKKGRLPANYNNDGDPQTVFDKAVQTTLKVSGVFNGLIDGKIERGGSYGIQDYAIKFGDYKKSAGIRDGKPGNLSWVCFALGLERP